MMIATAPEEAQGLGRTGSPRRLSVLIVTFLLVIGSVGWRRGEYFSGSVDPVVAAKALVSLMALTWAFLLAVAGPRRRLGTGSLWWLGIVLGSSAFGAMAADDLKAGLVLVVRVAVLALAVFFLLRVAPGLHVLTGIAWGCGVVAAVASVTGLPTLASGRLAGGIPAMDPNELALLAGVAVVFLVWRIVSSRAGVASCTTAAFFLAVMWVTGSRTALLMLMLGALVMLVHIRRPRVGLVVGGLVLGAGLAAFALVTPTIAGFAERNGAGTSTLDSRFLAWRTALTWAGGAWQTVFGGGLAVKTIRVHSLWRDTQPLDSSWVSVLVQAGVLGLIVAAGWALWSLWGALHAPNPHRVLFLGLLVFLIGRSFLESGLFDATPAFLLFLAVSLLGERSSRSRLHAEAAPG